jgi:hypothetical protein
MPHSGKACWPSKLGPCGALWRSPCLLGRVITTSSHGHSARDGEMTGGSPTANTRPNLRGNDLQALAYTPLHRTREGVAGRGVLTSEVFGAAGNGGVKVGNLPMEGDHFGLAPNMHKEGTHIRSPFEQAPDDERQRK